jgi:hypothetical protein
MELVRPAALLGSFDHCDHFPIQTARESMLGQDGARAHENERIEPG